MVWVVPMARAMFDRCGLRIASLEPLRPPRLDVSGCRSRSCLEPQKERHRRRIQQSFPRKKVVDEAGFWPDLFRFRRANRLEPCCSRQSIGADREIVATTCGHAGHLLARRNGRGSSILRN